MKGRRKRATERRSSRGATGPPHPAGAGVELPLPPGASARTVMLADDEYLIFAVPIPKWDIPEHLTAAERAIVEALLRGSTNEQIARERRTAVHTVANQIASVFTKLGVNSRIELAHRLRAKTIPRKNRP